MPTNSHKYLKKGPRMQLRPLTVEYAKRLYDYRSQPDVMLFQGWTPESPEEVADYARLMAEREFAFPGEWYQVVLELLAEECADKSIIGDVAFCIEPDHKKQAELGIALDTKFQGKGYAQEAITLLIDFLFEHFHLHRIHVSIDPNNHASRKLFSRVGFREEAHLKQAVYFKGEWVDDIVMAILKNEWQSKKLREA